MNSEEAEKQNSELSTSSSGDIGFSVIIMALLIILASLLDAIGFILFILSLLGVGIPASWVLDAIGAFTIGPLLYLFNRSTSGIEKGLKTILKIAPRFGVTLFIEAIPFLGDISPSWIILVIIEIVDKFIVE